MHYLRGGKKEPKSAQNFFIKPFLVSKDQVQVQNMLVSVQEGPGAWPDAIGEYSIGGKTSSIGKVLCVRYKNHKLREVSAFQKIKWLKT